MTWASRLLAPKPEAGLRQRTVPSSTAVGALARRGHAFFVDRGGTPVIAFAEAHPL